jgi:hypothetical protein
MFAFLTASRIAATRPAVVIVGVAYSGSFLLAMQRIFRDRRR